MTSYRSPRRWTWMFFGLILCSSTVAQAQEDYRVETFGSVGRSGYLVIFGPAVYAYNFGGGVAVRPFSSNRPAVLRMLGAEFETNVTRHDSHQQTYVTGNVVFNAHIGRVEPYFLFGGGFSHAWETHRAGDVGFGARVFLTPKISVRPELRAFVTEYLGNFGRASVGVGYHW